jgi:putative phosphoribosyl transferase
MNHKIPPKIIERPELRDCTRVFRNRPHAGEVLAEMLSSYGKTEAIVLAIPAGGVPVAAAIAERLHIPLDVAVVSKIALPSGDR